MAALEPRGSPLLDIYAQGAAVHLRVDEAALPDFAAYQGQAIQPSLEDVFVHYVKEKRREVAA